MPVREEAERGGAQPAHRCLEKRHLEPDQRPTENPPAQRTGAIGLIKKGKLFSSSLTLLREQIYRRQVFSITVLH